MTAYHEASQGQSPTSLAARRVQKSLWSIEIA